MNARQLAKALIQTPTPTRGLTRGAQPVTLVQCTVKEFDSAAQLLTVTLGGSAVEIPGVARIEWYVPAVGDITYALKMGSDLLVIGDFFGLVNVGGGQS